MLEAISKRKILYTKMTKVAITRQILLKLYKKVPKNKNFVKVSYCIP